MAVTLKSSAPAPTDRERIWAIMRELRQFTRLDLARRTGLDRKGSAIGDYLQGLEKAGFISMTPPASVGASAQYKLIRDVGVEAPRVNKAGTILPPTGRARMWKAMRILGTFTARELAIAASIDDAPVSLREAENYCGWLCRGGYLRGSQKGWAFIPARDSGPRAPQILRVQKLYDPNRNVVVAESTATGREDV